MQRGLQPPTDGAGDDELRSWNAREGCVEPLADSNDVGPVSVFVAAIDTLPGAPAVYDELVVLRTHGV